MFSQIVDLGVFLSTPSVRRATRACNAAASGWSHFYPRPPRGGRLGVGHGVGHHIDISIHALREEGDAGVFSQIVDLGVFLSTPSARRATNMRKAPTSSSSISIHALREEGDTAHRPPSSCPCHFYPRPPRGGRRVRRDGHRRTQDISIHALREEGDGLPHP